MTREIVVRCLVRDTARVAEALTSLGWGTQWIDEPLAQDTDDEGFVLRAPPSDAPAAVHAWPTHDDAHPRVPDRVLGLAVELREEAANESKIDWNDAWRASHPTRIEIIDEWVLVPPWSEGRVGERAIVIEPGAAFGTGNHPTTRDTLRLLHEAVKPNARVLDLGAGSGVLSIAAVLWGAGDVCAIDIDENAPAQIAANAARNGLASDRIALQRGDLVDVLRGGERWDIVLCNVGVAEVMRALTVAEVAVMTGGMFIASGVFAPSRERVEQAAPSCFQLCDMREEDRWVTLAWRAEVR